MADCAFIENVAEYGGAVRNRIGLLKLIRCQSVGSSATAGGGSIATDGAKALTLTDSLPWRNSAETGGAMHVVASAPILRNVTIASNIASYRTGGLFNYQSLNGEYSPTISTCIFWKNRDGGDRYAPLAVLPRRMQGTSMP